MKPRPENLAPYSLLRTPYSSRTLQGKPPRRAVTSVRQHCYRAAALAREAPLRDEYAPVREERAADVYPFPRNGERRTVQIKGQTVPPPRRRRSPASTRMSARPDRLALWALVLGLVVIAIAAASAHGATPGHAAPAAHVAHVR